MRRFPPSVGAVLAMDHNLLGNSTYLEPYPALVAFVNEHPEVIHNPSFFFGNGMGYRVNMDPAERAANTQKDVMGGLAALTAFGPSIGLIVWLIRTFVEHKRWSRQARVQTEFHIKLLDRFSSHDELLAYLQSPAGAKFLSASPIALDSPRTLGSLLGRIMWSAQAGVVLVAVLQSRWPDRVEAPLGARRPLPHLPRRGAGGRGHRSSPRGGPPAGRRARRRTRLVGGADARPPRSRAFHCSTPPHPPSPPTACWRWRW